MRAARGVPQPSLSARVGVMLSLSPAREFLCSRRLRAMEPWVAYCTLGILSKALAALAKNFAEKAWEWQ